MKPEEVITWLKGMQNKKVDYAEMVCAPGFCSGYEYVYPEPCDICKKCNLYYGKEDN